MKCAYFSTHSFNIQFYICVGYHTTYPLTCLQLNTTNSSMVRLPNQTALPPHSNQSPSSKAEPQLLPSYNSLVSLHLSWPHFGALLGPTYVCLGGCKLQQVVGMS